MCGITAFFSYEKKIPLIKIELLQKCNQEMLYRGPDEQDVWYANNVAMAHVRLSIIGISNGHQPIFNENKKLVLVCNGEIYNYKNLKESLISKGHDFKTNSDSEVILHLYEEYGADCVKHLDGMFAFCLYDIENKSFFLARDPAGKKPLYYAQLLGGVVFSSELKVIKKYFIHTPIINYEILRQVQKNSYSISQTDTYIDQIKKIPSGSFATIDRQCGLSIKKYFKRVIVPVFNGSYANSCKKVKDLLYNSIEKRLQSEVPVGILLSAGIDSSAIACIAKDLGRDVHVLSAGYKGSYNVDERNEAKKLTIEKGFIWNEVELDSKDFSKYSKDIYSILDEPVGDIAMFAQWGIYKKAKELGFKVLLSGNGGDELFYGYKGHNDYSSSLSWVSKQKSIFPIRKRKNLYKYLIKLVLNIDLSIASKLNISHEFETMEELIIKANLNNIPLERKDWHRIGYKYSIDNVYYFLHYAWLTNNCYFLADKLAMGNSIEVRSPFADKELIGFVDSLDLKYKFPNEDPKKLLKDSLKGVVPDYVLNRKKTGFTPPRSFINDIIRSHSVTNFKTSPNTFPQLITDIFANTI